MRQNVMFAIGSLVLATSLMADVGGARSSGIGRERAEKAPRERAEKAPRERAEKAPRERAEKAPRERAEKPPREQADKPPRQGEVSPQQTSPPENSEPSEKVEKAKDIIQKGIVKQVVSKGAEALVNGEAAKLTAKRAGGTLTETLWPQKTDAPTLSDMTQKQRQQIEKFQQENNWKAPKVIERPSTTENPPSKEPPNEGPSPKEPKEPKERPTKAAPPKKEKSGFDLDPNLRRPRRADP